MSVIARAGELTTWTAAFYEEADKRVEAVLDRLPATFVPVPGPDFDVADPVRAEYEAYWARRGYRTTGGRLRK